MFPRRRMRALVPVARLLTSSRRKALDTARAHIRVEDAPH
jgi:hypothetical protein